MNLMYGVDLRIQEDLCSDIFERFFFPLLMFVARCFSARFHGLGLFLVSGAHLCNFLSIVLLLSMK